MGNTNVIKAARTHFELSFLMLEKMIDKCPDDLWNMKNGGFVFWQQLLHAFVGVNFWMRGNNEEFAEPFSDRKLYPELDQDPEDELAREELKEYKDKVKEICRKFFEGKDDEWLNLDSIVYNKIKNIDIVFMQIRHIQYHVGHCNSILRDKGREAVDWLDYFGEDSIDL